jgi:FkbM family methyltransferase
MKKSFQKSFEESLHRRLLSLGWRIQREPYAKQGWEPGRAYWHPQYLQRLGFTPATVIDVGVGPGTPDLHEAYPKAELLLIEPVAEFAPEIAAILERRKGVHVPVALGAESGERELNVEPRRRILTSLYKRNPHDSSGDVPEVRRVPVRTLDSVVAELRPASPYGLKIDAEGAEVEILRGAEATLRETLFVIAEVGVSQRFAGGFRFIDCIAELDAQGFAVCDILDIGRANSSAVIFFDLVFARIASPDFHLR